MAPVKKKIFFFTTIHMKKKVLYYITGARQCRRVVGGAKTLTPTFPTVQLVGTDRREEGQTC